MTLNDYIKILQDLAATEDGAAGSLPVCTGDDNNSTYYVEMHHGNVPVLCIGEYAATGDARFSYSCGEFIALN